MTRQPILKQRERFWIVYDGSEPIQRLGMAPERSAQDMLASAQLAGRTDRR
jgi:hypothetical protein